MIQRENQRINAHIRAHKTHLEHLGRLQCHTECHRNTKKLP